MGDIVGYVVASIMVGGVCQRFLFDWGAVLDTTFKKASRNRNKIKVVQRAMKCSKHRVRHKHA